MRLVALPEKSGAANIHHFNLPNTDDSMRHYTIGRDPVEIPEADAKFILKISEKVGPVADEPDEQPEPRKTRRGKEAANEA